MLEMFVELARALRPPSSISIPRFVSEISSSSAQVPGETAFLDLVTVTKEVPQTNYDLDLEVSWSDVAFDEDNEWLCIYVGVQGPESLIVDAWDGGAWATVFNDLQPGWNNADVFTYLTFSTFTIRFRGGEAIGDTVQDSWEVDTTFLHVWTYTPP